MGQITIVFLDWSRLLGPAVQDKSSSWIGRDCWGGHFETYYNFMYEISICLDALGL